MGFDLIGLSGYAQVGKDSTANILKEVGYHRLAFADGVRDAVYRLDPTIPISPFGKGLTTVKGLVDAMGWDQTKQHPEVRRLLQVMGTEVGREMFGTYCWIDLCFRKMQNKEKIVVTDVRFVNEADEIKKMGGYVYRVTRPGFGAINNHASETSLDNYSFDGIIENNGTLDGLRSTVLKLIEN